MNTWNDSICYFKREELACRCCGELRLDTSVALHLPILRAHWADRLLIAVGSVCHERNFVLAGHRDSLHLMHNTKLRYPQEGEAPADPVGTLAVSIRWGGQHYLDQLALARMAYNLGWSVGLHRQAIAIDRRVDVGMQKTIYYADDWGFDFRKEHVEGADIARKAATG